MRYNKPRRFRSNDKEYGKNDFQDSKISGFNSDSKNFQRRSFSRNSHSHSPSPRAEKLLEKYNNLAKEALSNGDKILSESYYQHADHFLRVIENRNSIQNNSKPHLDNSPIKENSDDKIILEDKKHSSSQQPQNSEESTTTK